jgi:hypothetical protein
MNRRRPQSTDLAALVDHMFADVLKPDERQELLGHIEEWEAANPDVSPAQRVTAWIDVAYEFQARRRPEIPDSDPAGGSQLGT